MSRELRTYNEWDAIRLRGRGGKKKIRRDTTLSKDADGTLVFTYGTDEVLVRLTPDDTYTLSRDADLRFYPTYSNIFQLVAKITVHSDSSRYKNHRNHIRIYLGGVRWIRSDDGSYSKDVNTLPFVNGIQFRYGYCLNPQIATDYKRTLNRAAALPWLRKTEPLAKVLRVATRMQLLDRKTDQPLRSFASVNLDDPTAEDAEIILRMGNALGLSGWRAQNHPETYQAALMRAANNGLADYREWLYIKHGCYDMVPVEYKLEGATQ